MRLIKFKDGDTSIRNDGRTVNEIVSLHLEHKDAVFYHCTVPKGQFGFHYHEVAQEIIWFPLGGNITVNDIDYELSEWDAVLLEPGDVHGYLGDKSKDIIHFAIKFPNVDDKKLV